LHKAGNGWLMGRCLGGGGSADCRRIYFAWISGPRDLHTQAFSRHGVAALIARSDAQHLLQASSSSTAWPSHSITYPSSPDPEACLAGKVFHHLSRACVCRLRCHALPRCWWMRCSCWSVLASGLMGVCVCLYWWEWARYAEVMQ
jgi:hypothetical protein